jgi:hypothetical protein
LGGGDRKADRIGDAGKVMSLKILVKIITVILSL